MEIKIQFATLKNLADIQDLNQKLCIKENKEFDSTINVNYPLQKSEREYFEQKIKFGCALVAIADGKVVGYLVGTIGKPEVYRTISRIAEAENMFILEEYRSFGIGKQLFNEFAKWCKSKGAERIRAVTSAHNKRAIEFYRREGFIDYTLTLEKEI